MLCDRLAFGKKEMVYMLFVHLYGYVYLTCVTFLLLLFRSMGVSCGLLLWHSLDFSSFSGVKIKSKKISNDQELIQSDPTYCPQNQKGNN